MRKKLVFVALLLVLAALVGCVFGASETLLDSYASHSTYPLLDRLHPTSENYYSAYGQTFNFSGKDANITKAAFVLLKAGSPTGNATVQLFLESGGKPTGSALATSNPINVSTFTGSTVWYNFTFTSSYKMSAGTTYCISYVNPEAGTVDDSNYVRIGAVSSGTDDGNGFYFRSSAWSTSAYDTAFKVYGLQGETFSLNSDIELDVDLTSFARAFWVPPPFSYPDFASLLSGFVTASFIYPVMIIGMVAVGLTVLYYGRGRVDPYSYVQSAPWLLVLAAIGLVGVFVYYVVISAILGAF